MARKPGKRGLRIGAWIVGGVVAALLAYVHTPLFRGTVERRLAAAIRDATGRETTVRLARLRPLALRAQVEEIRIAGRHSGGTPFLELGDSTVNARLLALLTGRLHLSEVTIADLSIDLDELPATDAEATAPRAPDARPPTLPDLLGYVTIDRAAITGGQFHFSRPGVLALDADFRLALDRSPAPERYRVTLAIDHGVAGIPRRGELPFALAAEIGLDATELAIPELRLLADGIDLRGSATSGDPWFRSATSEIELRLSPDSIPATLLLGIPLSGATTVIRGTASIDATAYQIDFRLDSPRLGWEEWTADGIAIELSGSETVWNSTFALSLAGVAIEGGGRSAPPPALAPLTVQVEFATSDAGPLARTAAGSRGPALSGSLSGRFVAEAARLAPEALRGTFEIETAELALLETPGAGIQSRIEGSVDAGVLTLARLEARGLGMNVEGSGHTTLDEETQFEVDATVDDPGAAARALGPVLAAFGVDAEILANLDRVGGKLTLSANLNGTGLRNLSPERLAGDISVRAERLRDSGENGLALDAEASGTLQQGRLAIEHASLRSAGLSLAVEGKIGASGADGLSFAADLEPLGPTAAGVLEEIRSLGLQPPDLAAVQVDCVDGSAHLEGRIDGPWNSLSGTMTMTLRDLGMAGGPTRRLDADVSLDRGEVGARARLVGPGAEIDAGLHLGSYSESPLRGTLDTKISEHSPSWWLDLAGVATPVEGRIEGRVAVDIETLAATASLAVAGGSVAGFPFELHGLDVKATRSSIEIGRAEFSTMGGKGTAEGTLDGVGELRVRGTGFDLGQVLGLAGAPVEAGGTTDIDLRLRGLPGAPSFQAQLTLEDLVMEGRGIPTLEGELSYDDGGPVWIDLREPGGDGRIHASAPLDLAGPWNLEFRYPLRLDIAELTDLANDAPEMLLDAEIVIDLEGQGTDAATIRGMAEARQLRLRLGERTIVADGGPLLRLENGRATLSPFRLVLDGNSLTVEGLAELSEPYSLSVSAVGDVDLEPFAALLPGARIDGNAGLELRLGGTLTEPAFDGTVNIEGGRLAHPSIPLPLERISATLTLDPERVQVDNLSLRLGGEVRGSGEYFISGPRAGTVRAELHGDGLRMRPQTGLRIQTDALLKLDGDFDEWVTLSGRFDVERAAYEQDVVLQQELLARVRAPTGAAGVESWLDRFRLNLDVEAPRGAYVRNNLLAVQTAASLKIGGTLASTRLTGRIDLEEGGQLFFRGVTYSVVRGNLDYRDDPPEDGTLDIQAETSIASYDITLRATGRMQDPRVELSSSPALEQADIVSLLVTGKTREGLGSSNGGLSSAQAAIYLTRGFTNEMQSTIERSLGIDTLRIDPVLIEGETDPAARVTVGKSLTGKLEASYSWAISGNQEDIYQLRYRPRERISFVGRRDEEEELSGDILYGRKFYVGLPVPTLTGSATEELRISQVSIDGNRAVGTRKLKGDLGQGIQHAFRRAVLLAGLDAVRDRYVQYGYPEAQVDARVSEQGDGVAIDVTIDEGREVQVRLEGLSRRGRGIKRELLTLWQDSVFLDTIADDASASVRKRMMSAGYVDAQASGELIESGEGRVLLRVAVELGSRVRVSNVFVEGNTALDEERIRAQMLTRETTFFDRARLAPDVLRADRDAIRSLYLGLGYLDVEVAEPAVNFSEARDRADVVIVVSEGRLYRVGQVEIAGNSALTTDEVRELALPREAEPCVEQRIRDATSALRKAHDSRGYPEISVEVRRNVDREAAVVNLEFRVEAGPHKQVESVEVAGASLTRERVMRREVSLKSGDPLSAEEVAGSQQALYRTGLFRSVTIDETPGLEPDGRNLRFTVEESPTLRTDVGLGYSTDDEARTSIALSHINLFGQRLYGSTGARLSARDWRVFALARQPRLFGSRFDGMVSTFVEEEHEDAFEVDRIGVTSQIDWKSRTHGLGLFLGYGLEQAEVFEDGVRIEPVPGGKPPDIDDIIDLREESILRLGNINTGFVLGQLDNIVWPTGGSLLQGKFSRYDSRLRSEADFTRVFGQLRLHRRLGSSVIWNLGARAGVAEPDGSTPLIPISERFFAGGDNSIRGFDTDSLQALGFPRDELDAAGVAIDESLGGAAEFIVNNELVAPLFDPIFGVVFYDAGNLYWELDDFDVTDLRHSAGLGLRVRTPVGPIRLEYGWKLDRQQDESSGRLHFSIGLAF